MDKVKSIEEAAEQYAKDSFVWPKNGLGEDMVQRVGQKPHGWRKHSNSVKKHFKAGAQWQQSQQPEIPETSLMGWECPRCRTIHSPFTTTCGCPPPTITTNEIIVSQWLIDHNANQ